MSLESAFSSGEVQLVTFTIGPEIFGLDIMNVQEVIRMPAITKVPQSPSFIEGMTNLRGHILPVIDTRTKFGMEKVEMNESSRVIVVDIGGKAVGLNVDSVSEVLRVDSGNIENAPASLSENVDSSSITGVVKLDGGKKLVMVLDSASLFGQEAVNKESFSIKSKSENFEALLDEVQIVSFLVGKEEFGLEIDKVKEIIRFPEIVKVPNVPNYMKGIISLRDTLMPIVDLRTKLGTGLDEVTPSTRVVVVDVSGTFIGLTVDQVYEVIRIPKDAIFQPPQAVLSETGEKLTGIARLDDGKRIIMLMDPQNIINQRILDEINSGEAIVQVEPEDDVMDELDEKQLVVFKLAEEQYGVSIAQVQEITKMAQITKVPRSPKFVQGVVNLRGDVIPIIDMRKRFDMESKDYTDRTRIIVSEMNNQKIGLIVDEVLEV
ncbi:MAG TPA: chemotaxis protein CheW, partial [Syntrophomonadaceae bacterium]|nr:chemotaxis protein CheW [Syntrophomonadaceae bacterium]